VTEPDNKHRIWQVVHAIPAGRVSSYGRVARLAGLAGAARLTGHALRGLPPDTEIPWHRVINSQGKISLPPGSKAYREQQQRLLEEGVFFTATGRLRSKDYWWP
jgi:methylated-DNA-protein-cysteine methyltransferase-like protein